MTSVQAGIVLQHIRRLAGMRPFTQPLDGQLLKRFISRRDEAAFADLVRRHGPMVLNVCRSVLHHEQDAEDAFQATFLVLARKAASIRRAEAVAGWLYEVAYHVAVKAQADRARRRIQERRDSPMAAADPTLDMTLRDLRRVLHEELRRLPEKYRLPLVLCYLEGRSHEEAAEQLGWSKGTFRGRLDRGREHLRRRLAARGVALSALLCAMAVAPRAAAEELVDSIVRAAVPSAAGGVASGIVSARAAALAQEVTRAMFTSKLKVATALLLALCIVATGASVLRCPALATAEPPGESQKTEVNNQKPKLVSEAAAKQPEEDDKGDSAQVNGRVVGPDGKPFAGAKVFFARYVLRDPPPQAPAAVTSDTEGRFHLRISRTGYPEKYMKNQWMQGAVVAVGEGFTFGWAGGDANKLTNVTVKLGKEVPIQGRVVDLQGKPIAGVKVQPRSVMFRSDGGDLQDFVEGLKKERLDGPHHQYMRLNPAALGLTRPVVTGADGKFRLTGISPECVVGLRIEGPTIETAEVDAMTRPTPTIVTLRSTYSPDLGKTVFHGNTFDHAAAPTRPIEGIVRDRDTGKPLAGVTIQAHLGSARAHMVGDPTLDATTDEHGRYRLVGLSRDAGQRLLAVPPDGQPYLRAELSSGAATGLDPVTLDFSLKRGVLIRGRVTNKETGRPVAAQVTYFAFDDNPYVREAPGYRHSHSIEVRTAEDGSFTVIGLPGRGLVAAKAADREREGHYLMGVGGDQIQGPRDGHNFITHPNICHINQYNTLAEVNLAKDAESVVSDVAFDPGKTVTGTIMGPDGQPVTGGSIDSVFGVWFQVEDLPTAQFRIPGIDPKHPRAFYFRHHGQNLGAAMLIKGNEPMPLTVRLQKCATLTGRLVDEGGLPRSGFIMGSLHPKGPLNINGGVGFFVNGSGKDGRFHIDVIPGIKFGLHTGINPSYYNPVIPELMLKPGEVKDLGDLKVTAPE